ncbi:MAG: hypothetical protein NTNFB02_02970 [Nitrospira sp.]
MVVIIQSSEDPGVAWQCAMIVTDNQPDYLKNFRCSLQAHREGQARQAAKNRLAQLASREDPALQNLSIVRKALCL